MIRIVGISKGEANALLILTPLLVFTIVAPPLLRSHISQHSPDFSTDQAILDSIISAMEKQKSPPVLQVRKQKSVSPVPFDPNSSSLGTLVANGIPEYLAKRIINYRSQGGRFRKKEDIKKIYGFDEKLYKSVVSYIILNPNVSPVHQHHTDKFLKKHIIHSFDINKADSSTLKQINGIGDKLSKRIVNFRNTLGGFVNTDQLYQVYGLKSSIADSLLVYGSIAENFTPTQINVNTDTIRLLSSHPYISYKLAKAIINYRKQHGHYTSLGQIKNIRLVSDSIFHKISPYLKL